MIRKMQPSDVEKAVEIHRANGLDERCFPNILEEDGLANPLFIEKEVVEIDGQVAMMGFLKITSEVFFLVDHKIGTPEQRWQWLREGTEHLKQLAWKRGLEQITAFVPPEIEDTFAKRLLDLGFVKSPWQSYTLNLQ
jgi:hypothetical protein